MSRWQKILLVLLLLLGLLNPADEFDKFTREYLEDTSFYKWNILPIVESRDRANLKREITKDLTSLFFKVQQDGMNDNSFGLYASRKIIDETNIDSQLKKIFVDIADEIDWEEALSLQNLRNSENSILHYLSTRYLVNDIHSRYTRITNDRVDHRLENRREILIDYMNYYALESHNSLINHLKKRDHQLKKMSGDKGKSYKLAQQRLTKFIQMISAPEKGFIDRYFSSSPAGSL